MVVITPPLTTTLPPGRKLPAILLTALTTMLRERLRLLMVTLQAIITRDRRIHIVHPVIMVLLPLITLLPLLPALYPVQAPDLLPLASVLQVFTGCLIQAAGVWLTDQLMCPAGRRPVSTRPALLPAVRRLPADITAAASLMTRSLKNAGTAPVREGLTGTAQNV